MTDRPYSQMHPGLQLLLFVVVCAVTILAGYFIGSAIITALYGVNTLMDIAQLNISTANDVRALWILQIVSTTIPLGIIPIFFAYVVVKEPRGYLKFSRFNPILLFVVLLIMFMSLPVEEVLSNLNQRLTLPSALNDVEQWMKASEKQAERVTNIILKMNTPLDLVKVLLLVAATTAIVEELMFRGSLQTIFIRWSRNPHAGIWITAALFSAFHMEFFGFLPRLMLGVFFGYFVYWSGSIWPAIWGHFLNNGTAVVLTYLFQHKLIKDNPEEQHIFSYSGYLFSMIITVLLFVNFRNISLRGRHSTSDGA
ncbi:CPBP family intramembrane metalloprotease [Mucilaginibacter sp. RS28]|uniref:CPBP family intramembrane metalloprotease n=1 Tax=Mucilaginibacter straminoryzae TaxID=2932774 RepID=A0A9X1X653_9SPHI|nr:CPBP family intramembrane glutamic endopeptidase [Mucilaginibacter straminoryzae]MCJ8211764.1 CPBP family intramembrane metalloprotease [Mucilaginibacter straminoryzae]